MAKPRVFVTRAIPAAGLEKVRASCDAEIWPEQMPPSPEVLKAKLATCDGVLSLLTDRFDAAVMDVAPGTARHLATTRSATTTST